MGKVSHRAIESYDIPAQFVGHPTSAQEPAPRRFRPIFRDRDELPASANLGAQIEDVLCASRFLIVVCSRQAAQSQWVNKEIETFRRVGKRDRVLPLIVDGEPGTGDGASAFRGTEGGRAARRRCPSGGRRQDQRPTQTAGGHARHDYDALKQRDTRRPAPAAAAGGRGGVGGRGVSPALPGMPSIKLTRRRRRGNKRSLSSNC